MKMVINQIVFQIIKECDQFCPHCFFNSSPRKKEKLTLTQIKNSLNDLKKSGIKKINKFIISGGEPTLHPDIIAITKLIKVYFPFSKIRIDTNGLNLYENQCLFKLLKTDTYDISIDLFHNQGILKNEKKFQEFFVKKDGSSVLLDFFIKQKRKHGFDLNVRWTSNRKDDELFNTFKNKYEKDADIIKKNVTATGRAKSLPNFVKGAGFLIEENPSNFKCLIGDSLLMAVDGYWYGCYHPVSLTKLSSPGKPLIFKQKLEKLLNSNCGKDLPKKGIANVLKSMKNKNLNLNSKIDSILKKKYWYRCQPCEDACMGKIF